MSPLADDAPDGVTPNPAPADETDVAGLLRSLRTKFDSGAVEGRLIVQVLLRYVCACADTNASQLTEMYQSHKLDVLLPNQRRAYQELIADQEAIASDARELLRRVGLGNGRLFDPDADGSESPG